MAKKPRNPARDYVVYLIVRLFVAVIQMLSPRITYAVADGSAWLIYKIFKSRRRIAMENIQASFPELAANPAAADQRVRDMYRHFMRVIAELLWLPRKLHPGNWRKYFVVPHGIASLPLVMSKRSTLIVTAHFGNWEMAGFIMGLFGFRTHAIARALDNPYLERFALHFRQRTGQTIIGKNDDFVHLTDSLKAGGKVATLADQDAGPRGVFVDFFGRPASTHKAIALMAIEFDAVMAVVGVPRVNRENYPQSAEYDPSCALAPMFYEMRCVDVIDPRDYANDPNAVKSITQRYTTALEMFIRQYPEQYFWLHRRWKHQPKAKGKPAEPKAA